MKKSGLLFILLFCQFFVFGQTKIDEYDRTKLVDDDEYFRLSNLAEKLNDSPGSKGYIIAHRSKMIPLGRFLRNVYGAERFWANWLKQNPKLLVTLIGEDKEEGFIKELWIVPEGKELNFKIISLEEKLKEKISVKTLFDSSCLDCTPDPPISLDLFEGGLKFYFEALKANPQTDGLIVISGTGATKKARTKDANNHVFKIRKKLNTEFKSNSRRIKIIVNEHATRETPAFADLYVVPQAVVKKK